MNDAEHDDHRQKHTHDQVQDQEDAHGHDPAHGHAEHWGDYNAQAEEPSALPEVSPLSLAVFGVALAAMLASIAFFSLSVTGAARPSPAVHVDENGAGEHPPHESGPGH